MKKTPAQKTELKLRYVLLVIILLIVSAWYCCNKYTPIYHDRITGTKIYDRGNYNEVVFSNGEVLAYGNEKTEYENNEIGE